MEKKENGTEIRGLGKRAIWKAKAELDRKFEEKPQRSFQKGELVWYFDKVAAMRHDTKFQPKWKGPYQIVAVLDKGTYRLSIDEKRLNATINGNLLKLYNDRSTWEPIVIVESQ